MKLILMLLLLSIGALVQLPNASCGLQGGLASRDASAAPASSAPSPPAAIDKFLDSAERFLKVLAYLVGSFWVYFNYFKGRTYQLRLDNKIQAIRLPPPNDSLAKVTKTIKNVGLSKITLMRSGSAVRIEAYDTDTREWQFVNGYEIMDEESLWVEPSETLEEQLLVHLAEPLTRPFRVQLVLNSGKFTWETSAIVQNEKGESS